MCVCTEYRQLNVINDVDQMDVLIKMIEATYILVKYEYALHV